MSLKTFENDTNVEEYLQSVEHKQRREDSLTLLSFFKDIAKQEPKMWGTSIVGFGKYHYKTKSGREGEMPRIGFAPRKNSMVLYITDEFEKYPNILSRLGKHKTGKSCLYVSKLSDVDIDVLKELIEESLIYMDEKYKD